MIGPACVHRVHLCLYTMPTLNLYMYNQPSGIAVSEKDASKSQGECVSKDAKTASTVDIASCFKQRHLKTPIGCTPRQMFGLVCMSTQHVQLLHTMQQVACCQLQCGH